MARAFLFIPMHINSNEEKYKAALEDILKIAPKKEPNFCKDGADLSNWFGNESDTFEYGVQTGTWYASAIAMEALK